MGQGLLLLMQSLAWVEVEGAAAAAGVVGAALLLLLLLLQEQTAEGAVNPAHPARSRRAESASGAGLPDAGLTKCTPGGLWE